MKYAELVEREQQRYRPQDLRGWKYLNISGNREEGSIRILCFALDWQWEGSGKDVDLETGQTILYDVWSFLEIKLMIGRSWRTAIMFRLAAR